jgi:hypothetical protein
MQRGLFHFCIVIEAPGAVILCDPWLSGEVFNQGWQLAPPPLPVDGELARVTHLFISHEHPTICIFQPSPPFRYRTLRTQVLPRWKIIRIVSSLYNAEIYLTLKGLFRPTVLAWIWQRRADQQYRAAN